MYTYLDQRAMCDDDGDGDRPWLVRQAGCLVSYLGYPFS